MFETKFLPFLKMIERLEISKDESDSAYFSDLMYFGELLSKVVISGIIAGIVEDRDKNRYRLMHRLVRANGIGEWSMVLDEVLVGVPSQFLQGDVRIYEKKELTQKTGENKWQYECLQYLFDVFKILEVPPPYPKLPTKLSAKLWFSQFAQLRNKKAHGATLPSVCAAASNPLEKSIQVIVNNFSLFKREWVYLYQNMSGKYRVTNLNNTTLEFDQLKSDPSFVSKYKDGVYTYFDERTSVDFIFSTPEGADFSHPNGNFKADTFEILSYISDTRKVGDGSKYLIPAENLPASDTEGLGNLEVLNDCFSNIPPIYAGYINRNKLEKDLADVLLEDDRYPIVTLKGSGGIGKTSLALAVLLELSKTNRFDVMFWFSSRDVDLRMAGPKPVKTSVLNEHDVATEFAKLLERPDLESAQDKVSYFSGQLTKCEHGPTLFVFDNFETVENPAEFFVWLDTFIRHPNKILITSRSSTSFKADYPIEVLGMEEPECRELIEKTAKSIGVQDLLTKNIIENIIRESDGHPYIIKILVGEFSRDAKSLNVKRVVASKDDILIALFRRTFDWLSPGAKRVFLTLCSWNSVVPQIALEAVLLRPENERIEVDEAVEELRRSSFVEVLSSDQEEEIFLRIPLAASVFGKKELEVSPEKIAILNDRELLEEFGASQQSDIVHGIKPRIIRKFNVVADQISQGKISIEEDFPALEYIARRYPDGWIYLSKLYRENGNVLKAKNALQEFLKSDVEIDRKKEVWEMLADLYGSSEDWFGRINALVEKISLGEASVFEISEVANEINRRFQKEVLSLDTEVKRKIVEKVTSLMERKLDDADATDFSRLAWLFLSLKDDKKAREMTEKGLASNPSNEHCLRLASKLFN